MAASNEEISSAIKDLKEYMHKLFETYQLTGDIQNILAGMFRWIKEDKDPITGYIGRMSPGELKSAIREGFPEVFELTPEMKMCLERGKREIIKELEASRVCKGCRLSFYDYELNNMQLCSNCEGKNKL